jgi:actin-like ATPase involved in cell morphogenesis
MSDNADVATAALVYGIDIGDWNCAIAVGRQGSTFDLLAAQLIPSAVAVADDGTYLAGWPAYRELRHEPSRYRRGLNRAFGQDERIWMGEGSAEIGHLMSLLLRELRISAEAAVPGVAARVAIAVPSGWGEGRRAAILDAAAAAGFDALRMILVDRPVAAVSSAAERMKGDTQQHLLVYDLGGTSFACTLVRRTAVGRLVALGQTTTRTDLGAAAFDQEVISAMAARSPEVSDLLDAPAPDADQRHRIAGLQSLAESIKVLLSTQRDVRTYVTLVQPGFTFEADRDAFNEAIRLSVAATVATCDGLLSRHDLSWLDVDAVVLAGGGSNLPLVEQSLGAASGHVVDRPQEPELVVSRGAAHQAAHEIRARNDEKRAAIALEASRPVPVTGRLAAKAVAPSMFSAALVAWLVWAASGGWFTATHWHGFGMWATLATGALMPVLLAVGYFWRYYPVAAVTFALASVVVPIHVVTLVVCGYRAIFTDAEVGWIPFACTVVPAVAVVAFGAAVFDLEGSISSAREVKKWAAGRRAMVQRVQREKEIGAAALPAFVSRLVREFGAARGFTPASGPFDFAVVMGRTLLLGSSRLGRLPAPGEIGSAVDAYLGKPDFTPDSAPHIAERFAQRAINVHCFLTDDVGAASESYLAEARKSLNNTNSANASAGEPAVSTTLAVVNGGDMETRLRRLLDRADRELYLPLLERAAEAAGVKG